jgi:hypothetical protein
MDIRNWHFNFEVNHEMCSRRIKETRKYNVLLLEDGRHMFKKHFLALVHTCIARAPLLVLLNMPGNRTIQSSHNISLSNYIFNCTILIAMNSMQPMAETMAIRRWR